MDFELTEEQVMLRDTVRDLLSRAYDSETRLKVTETELGWSRDVWRHLAEVGVLGLGFSEEDGGAGAAAGRGRRSGLAGRAPRHRRAALGDPARRVRRPTAARVRALRARGALALGGTVRPGRERGRGVHADRREEPGAARGLRRPD